MSTSLAQSQGATRFIFRAVTGKQLNRFQRRSLVYCGQLRAGTYASPVPRRVSSWWPQMDAEGSTCVPAFTMRLNGFSSKATEDKINLEKETVAETLQDEATIEPADEASTEHEQLQEKSRENQLEEEIKSLKDQLLRSLAEQDNTRRIAQRDVDAARQFAIKSFAKSLLDVSDNLGRALEAVPKEEIDNSKESTRTLATLYEGIEMTERGLNKAFEVHGLVKYGQVGELFDPNQHEALYEYSDPSKVPGTIGQVIKSGFLLNKRVLRPAEVAVVRKDK